MEKVVCIKNVEKNYGKQTVLASVDLTIAKGEVFVLLGKNGAGKSTLFKIITGLTKATNGAITILGAEVNSVQQQQKIGCNINEPVFYEHLTARENLEIHCEYMNCSGENIAFWLNKVGLSVENNVPVRQYSLGMRQRLVLARCLVHDPEILVIDEPLNGLDPKGIKQFRGLIEQIASTGKTIIMSSHILAEVATVATRIAVITNGRVVLDEAKQTLISKHQELFEDFLIEKMEGENE